MNTQFDLNSFLILISDIYTNGFNINYLQLLSLIAIISSILVISSRNPIVSILYLISLFLTIAIYLILIGLTFIGLSYLLVYIGAVSMLFLFILMLIDIRVSELHEDNKNGLLLSFFIGSLFFLIIEKIVTHNYSYFELLNNNVSYSTSNTWDGILIENYDIISIGNVIYTNYAIWLIIASLILLLAMVGSIIINISSTTSSKI